MNPAAFRAVLFRWDGAAPWTFVVVPPAAAPLVAGPWGRAPVTATVDGITWQTSVWTSKEYGWLLAVPARVRGSKGHGDEVSVAIGPSTR